MTQAVLVTGSRDWTDASVIERELAKLPKGTIIIHGDARGADTLAGEMASTLRLIEVKVPYIGWLRNAGGPTRNAKMLDLLAGLGRMGYQINGIAFHKDLASSRGTSGMVALMEGVGISVKVVTG